MQPASEAAQEFRTFITSVNAALTLTSAIALFVGGFLVFLTFSLAVAERVRDHGTLRALGAQPRQVRRIVVVEALTLGAIASIGGLVLGYGIALGVLGLSESLFDFDAGDIGLPVAQAVISVVAALAGLGGGRVGAGPPRRRAQPRGGDARVGGRADRPVRPTRPRDRLPRPRGLLGFGERSTALRSMGVIAVLTGAVLAVPLVLGPLARVLGRATHRLAPGWAPSRSCTS